MAFATTEDVATRLGRQLDATETATVTDLLNQATGLIQGAARQKIELVEDDEITLRGSREQRILLPERPVVSVASVTLNGQALTQDSDWYLDGDELVRGGALFDPGHPYFCGSGWGYPSWPLVVTYTHGYETIPRALYTLTLGLVVRAFINPAGVMMERLGQAQMQYATQGAAPGMLLTADERRMIRDVTGRRSESLGVK